MQPINRLDDGVEQMILDPLVGEVLDVHVTAHGRAKCGSEPLGGGEPFFFWRGRAHLWRCCPIKIGERAPPK